MTESSTDFTCIGWPCLLELTCIKFYRVVPLTCLKSAPVDVFEEGLVLELLTVIIFKAEPLYWIFLHQPLTKVFALFAELGCVRDWIVQNPASHFVVFNLEGDESASGACFVTAEGRVCKTPSAPFAHSTFSPRTLKGPLASIIS